MPDRLTQLTNLHEADPKDPFLTYGIAMEYAKAERLDDALLWLDRTLAIDIGYCYAYFHKARLLLRKSDVNNARQTAQAGLVQARRVGDQKAMAELTTLLGSMG